jgi:spermidine/putrescine transport system substrate-binding protein
MNQFFRQCALLTLLLLTSCQSSNEPELHVFIWSDYIKPELVERFKAENHCQVIIDTYDSNESMYAKLNLGSGGYDVIFPSDYFMDLMIKQQMLQPIDLSQIPNRKNIDPKYMGFLSDSIQKHGIPYMISIAGVGYRKDKIDVAKSSWGIFGNNAYRGRMTMMNDIREVFAAALRYLGFSANTIDPLELHQATELLIEWKQNLAKFEGEQYKAGIASAEYLVVHGYNGDLMQVMEENPEVGFFYPEEGTILAMDLMAIPTGAPNKELALKFINFLLEPDVAAENMAHTYFFIPNTAALPFVPENLQGNPILFPPEEVLERTELTHDLGADNVLYLDAWEKVKGS